MMRFGKSFWMVYSLTPLTIGRTVPLKTFYKNDEMLSLYSSETIPFLLGNYTVYQIKFIYTVEHCTEQYVLNK